MFTGLAFLKKDESTLDSFLAGPSFTAAETSNLVDIFDADNSEKPNEENPSLKYIPLKQNQPQKTTDKSTWNVVMAKIVNAFKSVNGVNTAHGQLGFALLKNPSEDSSRLILYKTKEQILSTVELTKFSTVYWKPPYLQYHDATKEVWSLLFASNNDSADFLAKLKDVCSIDKSNDTETEESNKKPVESASATTKLPEPTLDERKDKVDSGEAVKVKSDIVYRVAKIGHQLPKLKPPADDDSDSTLPSDTERVPNVQPAKVNYDKSVASMHIPPKPANISVALQPSMWSSTFDLNSFASENRIQHTEVRMNLSKIDSKIDRVIDNVERLWLVSSRSSNPHDKEEEIIQLEEKMLELKKENRALKLQLTEIERFKVDSNSKDKEDLATLQKRNDENELTITELTSQVQELDRKLSAALESKEHEKQQLIENYTAEIEQLREEIKKESAQVQVEQPNSKVDHESQTEKIRSIMNGFYVKLYQSIEGKETMSSADVLKITAEIIRKETKAALNSN